MQQEFLAQANSKGQGIKTGIARQREKEREVSTPHNLAVEPIAVYCRVSTEEQRENHNIQTQISSAKSYIELQNTNGNHCEIAEWYLDDGASGTMPLENRPAAARLLSDAKKGKFKTVLVWKLDRLARKPSITLNAIDALERNGIAVKSVTESFDTSSSTGKLMLNMLASFAGFERDTTVERSIEGTNRWAKEGQWLGGIVPYGYEVTGTKREARLTVSEKPLPNVAMSEAEVVRLIYKWLAEEGKSCVWIADYLNAAGIPPAYTKDQRQLLKPLERGNPERGKRKERTSGKWTPGRIRNLVANPVYKGVHIYGKRSKRERELIDRPVPSIVSEGTWERAQQTLKANRLYSDRNAKTRYLLRGLVKCGYCNLNYVGCTYPHYKGGKKRYYRCNGKTAYRGLYKGECPSKAVNADALEEAVWKEVEKILLDPEGVIAKLNDCYLNQESQQASLELERSTIEKAFVDKQQEKENILDLYRRKLISLGDLERQLAKIDGEEANLRARLESVEAKAKEQGRLGEKLNQTEELLNRLQEVLANPISWEVKRQVIELLVWEIRIDTITEANKKRTEVTITFAFDKNTTSANHTDRDSWRRPA